MNSTDLLIHRYAIEGALIAYARACDERNWTAFDNIFHTDVTSNYGGEFKLEGRSTVVEMIRSMLGGCGPTQHLLGNFEIAVKEDSACSSCYVRAVHAGSAEK